VGRLVQTQAALGRSLIEHQGRGRACVHERQLEAQGNLDFIAVAQLLWMNDIAAVEMRAVLAAEVLQLVVILAPDHARVQPRHLPIVQHDVAIRAAPDRHHLVFERPHLPHVAALHDQHGRFPRIRSLVHPFTDFLDTRPWLRDNHSNAALSCSQKTDSAVMGVATHYVASTTSRASPPRPV